MINQSLTDILIERYDKGTLDLSGVSIRALVCMQSVFLSKGRNADAKKINEAVHRNHDFKGKLV